MPVDLNQSDEEDADQRAEGTKSRFKEFECPDCSANNPCDPPFGQGDELICNYCGSQFVAKVSDAGKLKLREA